MEDKKLVSQELIIKQVVDVVTEGMRAQAPKEMSPEEVEATILLSRRAIEGTAGEIARRIFLYA